ncbi:MAG TPA: response regulator transcription factor [Fimbriiglobus sp.]|jgi:two-component system phosphate regulon response regulator PhoB
MPQPRILVIEDEKALAELVAYNLRREGFEITTAADGKDGLQKAQTILPDVVILDLMLPEMSGQDVCKAIRAGDRTKSLPILMLTAKSEETDQVVGFSLGADDYVTKPFSVKVLVQRVKAILRRRDVEPTAAVNAVVEHASVRVDRVRHKVFAEKKEVDLTRTEFRLLECLVRQPGRVYTRPQLLTQAMEDGTVVLERTIDVHIKSVRKKLGNPDLIETVRGVGYRFRDDGE